MAAPPAAVRTLATHTVGGPACCAAAADAQVSTALVVGTYALDEAAGVRRGQLHLFQGAAVAKDGELRADAVVDLAGVFDVRWKAGSTLLAVATADGKAAVCQADTGALPLRVLCDTQCTTGSPPCMCTSVDWVSGSCLVACDQAGCGHLLQLAEAGLTEVQCWQAHSLEAWVARKNAGSEHMVLTGADDACFKGWDTRSLTPVFVVGKEHRSGVCCIECDPHREHQLATGSYDESIRLWDLRQPREPICTAAAPCGGGVWRMAWHPTVRDTLLAACMQGGFAVVGPGLSVDVRYGEAAGEGKHGSLAYGVAWCSLGLPGCYGAVSCSFYDRTVHVWTTGVAAL